jgi:glyoxylase-like metal-dependent hydrolase (beta-lactamase superfamily II)
MRTKTINDYTTAFIFDEIEHFDTAVFLINKPNGNYLIDTFCGADAMRGVLSHIEQQEERKRLVVINTHHHWDHIWGNCLFEGRTIIAHKFCRTMIKDTWKRQISENSQYIMGDNEMVLPNLIFQESIVFEDDGLEIFYSPGHTKDSISVYDREQSTLIVGDNLEKPLLYIENPDIRRYLETLEKYIDYRPKIITSSHSVDIDLVDLEDTTNYIKKLITGTAIEFKDPEKQMIHQKNLEFLKMNT